MNVTKRTLACPALALFSVIAAAQDVPAKQLMLNIEAQPMVDALNGWAQQTGLQLIVPEGRTTNRLEAPSVKGRFTAQEALREILAGAPLTYEFVNERTVVIHEKQTTRLHESIASAAGESETKFLRLSAAQSEEKWPSGGAGAGSSEDLRIAAATPRDADRKKPYMEEVIVTAQKREERLIDVPISIVAMGADELQNRKISTIDDLGAAVPGMAIIGSGGFQRRIMLRGISNTYGTASLIGTYLDEAAVTPAGAASELDLRAYDLQRVEVLRGPQGTLYGAGSVGGTIRFITENPKLDGFASKADVTASFTEDGQPSQRVDAMANVPLIDDELGVRIAGTYERQGGWVDQPAAGRDDINDQEIVHVRAKGLWRPSPEFSVNAMAVIHRNDGALGSRAEDANGNLTQVFNITTAPSARDNYDIYNLTLTYDFDAIRVLSATSYIDLDKESKNYSNRPQIAAPPAAALRGFTFLTVGKNRILTQEIRLTSQGSGPWQWTGGGFYRDVDERSLSVLTQDGLFPTLLNLPGRTASESWAAFGDVSYQVTDRLKLGTGFRYFSEDQEAQSGLAIGAPAVLGPELTGEYHATNPRVYLQYKWTDDMNTYASAAKGFRSGGSNGVGLPNYGPESVWTYELGTKMSLAEGRLSTEAAVFYSDYTDYQVRGIVSTPPFGVLRNITSNAGSAKIRGIEWGVTWHPGEGWNLGFNSSYVKSKFYEINATNSAFVVGDGLDLVPKYNYTVSAEHEWTWSSRLGFVRLDYSQTGRSTYRNRSIGPWYYAETDVINQLNLNTSLQWSDSLSLGLFAENLLDDRGLTSPFATSDDIATRARPRTFGIRFGVSFE